MKIKPVDNVYLGAHLPPKQHDTKEMNKVKTNEVIDILRKWQLEADSGHNDGWTKKYYKDKIDEVVSHLTKTESEN
jgi:hypothetical protein